MFSDPVLNVLMLTFLTFSIRILSAVKSSVFMLSVLILNVLMLSF